MAYHHVADEAAVTTYGKPFQIWRCAHCRALYVGRDNSHPPAKCGRCHQ